jgi:hypothetical protein
MQGVGYRHREYDHGERRLARLKDSYATCREILSGPSVSTILSTRSGTDIVIPSYSIN